MPRMNEFTQSCYRVTDDHGNFLFIAYLPTIARLMQMHPKAVARVDRETANPKGILYNPSRVFLNDRKIPGISGPFVEIELLYEEVEMIYEVVSTGFHTTRQSHGTDEVSDTLLTKTAKWMHGTMQRMDDGMTREQWEACTWLGEEAALHLNLYKPGDDCTIPDWVWTLAEAIHTAHTKGRQ